MTDWDIASRYFFFCVRAEAAADLACLLAVLLFMIFAADEATLALVLSVDPFCVSAEAATDFSAFVAVLLAITFDAAEATLLLVLALLAIGSSPSSFGGRGTRAVRIAPDPDAV
jgi:hypothetical protein